MYILFPLGIILLENNASFLQEVVSILKNHSEPGGLHENTMLIVMGDHGQTLNGDHGGGTPKEVTFGISIFSPCFPFTNPTISIKSDESSTIFKRFVFLLV